MGLGEFPLHYIVSTLPLMLVAKSERGVLVYAIHEGVLIAPELSSDDFSDVFWSDGSMLEAGLRV